MGLLNLRPATYFDAWGFSFSREFLRRVLVMQVRHTESFVVEYEAKLPLALAMFWKPRAKRCEFALIVRPEAQFHMIELCRLAEMTLLKIAQNGVLVTAMVLPSDTQARRMARLVGFEDGKMRDHRMMIFRRRTNVRYDRQFDRGHGGKATSCR